MKKKFFLPIDSPEFICNHQLMFSNAILKAIAQEKTQILMCSKYINCYFRKDSVKNRFIILMYDHWCTAQGFMQYQLIDFLKETYQKEKRNLVLTLKKCLLDGAYVFGQCNRAYIEEDVGTDAPLFDYVITGFDDLAHEFTVYGIDSSENFSCYQVNDQKFVEALFHTPSAKIALTMWRHNQDAEILFDLPNIIFELEDYIHSVNNRNQYKADKFYGLNAMKELSRHFYETAQSDCDLNESYLRKFLVHKAYMRDRIACLASNGIIGEEWLTPADQVAKLGAEIFELGRNFNSLHDQTLIEKLVEMIAETTGLEADYLPKVLEELKTHHQTK